MVKSLLPVYGRASAGQSTFTLVSSAYAPWSMVLIIQSGLADATDYEGNIGPC